MDLTCNNSRYSAGKTPYQVLPNSPVRQTVEQRVTTGLANRSFRRGHKATVDPGNGGSESGVLGWNSRVQERGWRKMTTSLFSLASIWNSAFPSIIKVSNERQAYVTAPVTWSQRETTGGFKSRDSLWCTPRHMYPSPLHNYVVNGSACTACSLMH